MCSCWKGSHELGVQKYLNMHMVYYSYLKFELLIDLLLPIQEMQQYCALLLLHVVYAISNSDNITSLTHCFPL